MYKNNIFFWMKIRFFLQKKWLKNIYFFIIKENSIFITEKMDEKYIFFWMNFLL